MKRGDSDAETCALNGWTVGTQLVGDEGFGPTRIEITAIGERCVLAKTVVHEIDKGWARPYERMWSLDSREWAAVEDRIR
jgi:hypothetical protein